MIPAAIKCNNLMQVGVTGLKGLGIWQGTKAKRTGYWLRWWDETGQMLLWGAELVEQEQRRAQQERLRAERLAAQLREAGISPQL